MRDAKKAWPLCERESDFLYYLVEQINEALVHGGDEEGRIRIKDLSMQDIKDSLNDCFDASEVFDEVAPDLLAVAEMVIAISDAPPEAFCVGDTMEMVFAAKAAIEKYKKEAGDD